MQTRLQRFTLTALCLVGFMASSVASSHATLIGNATVDARQTNVSSLALDEDGRLWAISQAGLCGFDGNEWRCLRPDCTQVISSNEKRVWAMCGGNNIVAVSHSQLQNRFRASSASIRLLSAEGDDVFFSSKLGTFVLSGSEVRQLSERQAQAIVVTAHSLWLATDLGLFRSAPNEPERALTQRPTRQLVRVGDDEVIAGIEIDERRLELVRFAESGAPSPRVYPRHAKGVNAITVDEPRGALWVSHQVGIDAHQLTGGSVTTSLSMRHGLPYPNVQAHLHDHQGVWAGTTRELARIAMNPTVFNFGRPEGMDGDSGYAITASEDGLVFMTQGNGVTWHGGTTIDSARAENGLHHIDLRSLAVTKEHVWVAGMTSGLNILDLSKRTFAPAFLSQPPPPSGPHTLRPAGDGALWIGTNGGGLHRLKNHQLTRVFSPSIQTINRVHDVLEAKSGTLWLARQDGTVLSVKNNTATQRLHAASEALCLYEDAEGAVWVGTNGDGLYRIKSGSSKRFATAQGLLDMHIYGLMGDKHGWLWMSSPSGFFKMFRAQMEMVLASVAERATAVKYDVADDLRSDEGSSGFSPSSAIDSHGRVWFTTVTGAVAFDPDAILRQPAIKAVEISDVVLDGVDRTRLSTPAVIYHGIASFKFQAPALWNTSRIRYRSRLLGWQDRWIDSGNKGEANFASLRQGSYKFEVQAFSIDQPNHIVAAYRKIELKAPLFRRPWFTLLVASVAFAALVLAIVARQRRLQAIAMALVNDRIRIAHDIHDSLDQDLSGVKLHVDAANLWMRKNIDQAEEHLVRASALVVDGMSDVRSAIWGLRASSVSSDDLITAMGQRLSRIASAAGVGFDFRSTGTPITLPALVGTQLLYLAREAAANAVKHANATTLRVRLNLEGKTVHLEVHDDGRGFSTAETPTPRAGGLHGGLGLAGMRARAALIDAKLTIESNQNVGTRVDVKVDLAGRGNTRYGRGSAT